VSYTARFWMVFLTEMGTLLLLLSVSLVILADIRCRALERQSRKESKCQ
jgi:hypothetical protein